MSTRSRQDGIVPCRNIRASFLFLAWGSSLIFLGTALLSVSGPCDLSLAPRLHMLIHISVHLWTGHALEYGPPQFHSVHCRHRGILWHLRDRHVHGPNINHRQYPHHALAPICVWICLLPQGDHEQCVSRAPTSARRKFTTADTA